MNIEKTDQKIWLFVIAPILIIVAFVIGIKESLLVLVLALPFMLLLKNQFLESKVAWKDEYSVGIDIIDQDHKKLLGLIMEMFKALNKAKKDERAAEILDELIDYTVTHFDREEALMKKNGYPDIEKHISEHNSMRAKIKEFRANIATNTNQVSSEALQYLQDWLVNHITVTDQEYSKYFTEKGIKNI
ncbi:MAG: hemerythrin family protein [Magnetococcales bacterium]|nr:hemerythrin family protein [Magnetococcales bacterium]